MADEPRIVGQVDALAIPRFAGVRTFARLPQLDAAGPPGIAVLGAPFDGATTFRAGARFGPAAVREASLLLRPYNAPLDVSPFAAVQVVDAGDAPASPIDVTAAHDAIEASAVELVDAGARVLGLGGDHSVSLPLLRAAARRHGALALVQFDAHTDTWDSYFGARVTHGTMFRRAVEEGIVDASRSIQVGLRGSLYTPGDMREHADLGFTWVAAHEIDERGVAGVVETIRGTVSGPVYVTVDVDALDPAFAPGTGTPEAGGLTSRELLAMLRGLAGAGETIAGADVVEVAPAYDPAGQTAVAAANAAYELISVMALEAAARSGGEH
jgi:agmatinase